MASTQIIDQVSTQNDAGSQVRVEVEEKNGKPSLKLERRNARRCDFQTSSIQVERWDGPRIGGRKLGQILDLSVTGIRILADQTDLRVGAQLRIRMELPVYAGITPFVADDGTGRGSNTWCGWLTVTRVCAHESGKTEIAGKLVDMRDIDRGMLGLYLSAQPLAA